MKKILFVLLLVLPFVVNAQSWTTSGGNMYLNPTSAKLGIGTSSPIANLDVRGGSIYLGSKSNVNGWNYSYLNWAAHSLVMGSPKGTYAYNKIELKPGGSTIGDCDSEFEMNRTKTDYSSDVLIRLSTIRSSFIDGNLGIGTSNPEAKLDVIGHAIIRRALIIKGDQGNTEGSEIWLTNELKTQSGQAHTWKVFNMTGSYGNSLNFYGYEKNGTCLGNAPRFTISDNGNIGIGTSDPFEKLSVIGNTVIDGILKAKEIQVKTNVWADHVFNDDYNLRSLNEVEEFIKTNKHLPDVPSATQVMEEGINVAEMNAILLQKIEELTLLMIEQNKTMQSMQEEINSLK